LTDQTEKKFSHAAVQRFLSEKRMSSATSKSIFEYYKIGKGTTYAEHYFQTYIKIKIHHYVNSLNPIAHVLHHFSAILL